MELFPSNIATNLKHISCILQEWARGDVCLGRLGGGAYICSGWLRMQSIMSDGFSSPMQMRWMAVNRGNLELINRMVRQCSTQHT